MSKSNMLLGLAKGKVGDLVFYRDGGEQRTRTRVVPKNPRSSLQMAQRVRMANVPSFYRSLQFIMKDSFSNRPSNQSGYNAFAKGAIDVSPFLTREMALSGAVLPAPYVISRGVIAPLPVEEYAEDGVIYPRIALPDGVEKGTTRGTWSQALIAAYPQLQDGDVLTFVVMAFKVIEASDGTSSYTAEVSSVQFEIDSTSSETIAADDYVTANEDIVPIMRSAAANVGLSVIVSRKLADGSLQTSSAALNLDSVASDFYGEFRTDQALSEAIASYGRGEESLLR